MASFDSSVQQLSSRQYIEQSTHKGVSGIVCIDDLLVLESIDSAYPDAIGTAERTVMVVP